MQKTILVTFKTARWINFIVRRIRELHIFQILEPKTLRVTDFWLSKLIIDPEGHLYIVEPVKSSGPRHQALDVATKHLDEVGRMLEYDKQKQIIIPIWCIDGLNPHIEGVKALLTTSSSEFMNKQIEALRLEEPIDLQTKAGKMGAIEKTIVDLTPARMVILGNVNTILDHLKSLGRVFVFRQDDQSTAIDQLRRMIISQYSGIWDTNMMIAGFAGMFGVVSGITVSKILSMNVLQPGEVMAVFFVLASAMVFLMMEAFDSRIVAFRSLWTINFNFLSWGGFILLLILPPLMVFAEFPTHVWLRSYQYLSVLIIACCVVSTLGQVYFGNRSAISKQLMLLLWLTLAVAIISLPTPYTRNDDNRF